MEVEGGDVLLARKRSSERMAMALTRRMETVGCQSWVRLRTVLNLKGGSRVFGWYHRKGFRDRRASLWWLIFRDTHGRMDAWVSTTGRRA